MINIAEEIPISPKMSELLDQIDGQASDILSMASRAADIKPADLFAKRKRDAWHEHTLEARCDFTPHMRLLPNDGCPTISYWQKSVCGPTLTEIKTGDAFIDRFVSVMVPLIQSVLGNNLKDGHWAICATPKRRHLEHNFAESIASKIGEQLGIPFYDNIAVAATRQRINAIFTPVNIPKEPNIIIFDDFITTGSTLIAMKNMFKPLGKNCICFVGINNNF